MKNDQKNLSPKKKKKIYIFEINKREMVRERKYSSKKKKISLILMTFDLYREKRATVTGRRKIPNKTNIHEMNDKLEN